MGYIVDIGIGLYLIEPGRVHTIGSVAALQAAVIIVFARRFFAVSSAFWVDVCHRKNLLDRWIFL